LLSISTHPSILNITIVIITSWKILNCTQYRDSNNSRAMMGRWKKEGKQFSPAINLYRNQTEMKKTDTYIQTPTK
jgi:hypothetical protein